MYAYGGINCVYTHTHFHSNNLLLQGLATLTHPTHKQTRVAVSSDKETTKLPSLWLWVHHQVSRLQLCKEDHVHLQVSCPHYPTILDGTAPTWRCMWVHLTGWVTVKGQPALHNWASNYKPCSTGGTTCTTYICVLWVTAGPRLVWLKQLWYHNAYTHAPTHISVPCIYMYNNLPASLPPTSVTGLTHSRIVQPISLASTWRVVVLPQPGGPTNTSMGWRAVWVRQQ